MTIKLPNGDKIDGRRKDDSFTVYISRMVLAVLVMVAVSAVSAWAVHANNTMETNGARLDMNCNRLTKLETMFEMNQKWMTKIDLKLDVVLGEMKSTR